MPLVFEKRTFTPIPKGTYEVFIDSAEKKSANGKNRIALDFIIRNDVNQECQTRHIFDSIWENDVCRHKTTLKTIRKDDYDKLPFDEKSNYTVTKEYNHTKITNLIYAQYELPVIKDENGVEVDNPKFVNSFDDIDEVIQFLNGLKLKITVDVVTKEDDGSEKNVIDYNKLGRTDYPEFASTTTKNTEKIEVNDDDLPF
jgi:hypothetical protein